jgi:putative ABC transport system permease protein
MLKSYFKMAWRSLQKNKVSSFVNIAGLAISLATAVIIMLVVVDEFSYDGFHAHLQDIYYIMKNQKQSGGINTGTSTAGPLAAALRSEMPELKYAARVSYAGDQLVRAGDKSMFQAVMYTEPDFFNMMSFPATEGSPSEALRDPGSVLITGRTAKNLFGNEDPIGKTLVFDNRLALKVGAVLCDVPSNSSIQFDVILPFEILERENTWLTKWDDNRIGTWVQLGVNTNIRVLDAKMTKLLQARSSDPTVSLFAYPFASLRLHGSFDNGKPTGGRISMVKLLTILGLFILAIACINFMNIATARSEYRGREVGVRKVLGATRNQLIFQFLSEALLTAFLALALGLVISHVALPAFNQYAEKNIHFGFWDWRVWALLAGMGLFTGLLAGSYPALFLSSFKPVRVLKGVLSREKGRARFRRALVTIQFFISIFFIVGTIVIYVQINHVRNRPIGYDQENLIDIDAKGELAGKFEVFKQELAKIPGVSEVSAGSDNLLQFGGVISGMDWPGKKPGEDVSILVSNVQYNWIKTAGLQLVEGRDFNLSFRTDSSACLVNETTVQRLGLKEPITGQLLGGKTIIGVFHNFVFNNPSGIIAPMAIYLKTGSLSNIFVRIQNNGQWRQTLSQIKNAAKKINPYYPFEFSFIKEGYQVRFEEFAAWGFLATLFGGMAIFISCLGLFGLSAFLAEKRSKEMSIRKVFGAGAGSIWLLLSKDFLKPVFIAFILVVPLASWLMQSMLSKITYHTQVSWWMFVLTGLLAIIIALLTVSYQGIRAALENPVTKLRNE